eukprot:8842983-Alexandrium_andersonii.AAC.1
MTFSRWAWPRAQAKRRQTASTSPMEHCSRSRSAREKAASRLSGHACAIQARTWAARQKVRR